uniref:Uncharacterized protein n=1 Tax=Arundo donax TaxID=35708 RepID=A0A0A9FIC0_ARUDO
MGKTWSSSPTKATCSRRTSWHCGTCKSCGAAELVK